MVHQRNIEGVVGVHILQPRGELHHIHLQVDAEGLELGAQLVSELGAVDVGVGQRKLKRLVGGIAGFSHERLGLVLIIRVQIRQILVAGVERRDRAAERLVRTAARGDELLVVDGVTDGLTNALVSQFGTGSVVEAEHELVGAVAGFDRVLGGIGLERFGEVLGNRGEHLHVTGLQRIDRGVVVGQILDDHSGRLGLVLAPVLLIGLQRDRAVFHELGNGVGAGADGLRLQVILGILVEHEPCATGQGPQQVGVRRLERDHRGVGVLGLHLADGGERVGVVVALSDQLVDGPGHVLGVKFVAIEEGHVLIEVEGVGQAVLGRLPAGGDGGSDLVLGVTCHDAFVYVADQDLVKRGAGGVADVQIGGGQFEADGHGVGILVAGRSRLVIFLTAESERDADDDRHCHDDGNQ
ncbi:unknown [Bifidobacterium longum CAG:69]|nr:unknown [Bifidobacterium longum CAG:69]